MSYLRCIIMMSASPKKESIIRVQGSEALRGPSVGLKKSQLGRGLYYSLVGRHFRAASDWTPAKLENSSTYSGV